MRRYVPVATPVTMGELALAGQALFGGRACVQSFEELFKKTIGGQHSFTVSSGRAALYTVLKALSRKSPRKEVIIPAYTCPSVAAAIVKAGLKAVLCDIDKTGFGYDIDRLKRLIDNNTLAVICVHLFGIPTDVDEVIALAIKQGVFVIEDMAQYARPAQGSKTILRGDVAFYSLGRGKNITTGSGGVIITEREDIAREVSIQLSQAGKAGSGDSIAALFKMVCYSAFIHPSLYCIPEHLPFLRLGETIYSTDFAIRPFTALQAAIGVSMLNKLGDVNKARIQKAKAYSERLKSIEGLILPDNAKEDAVYLRYPVLVRGRAKRDDIYHKLRAEGLGASTMYPEPLDRIHDLKSYLAKEGAYPNAGRMADELLALPTHHFVLEEDIDRIVMIIRDLLAK